mmetsp:Transcript_30661/g.65255  ORF Transcript_30661/g.65255 Transcript_30661/m.65255 type:complete len:411 (+) Transcript_30661:80-1312(+)
MASERETVDRWKLPPRYEARTYIGTGSYGSVCEAYDLKRKRLVAVKRVGHLFEDLVDCKRILREVAILSKLRHDHVVQIHDLLLAGDPASFQELFIVMEVCDSDLKKLCRTDVTLTPLHVNTMLYNLLVGLNYLHSAGILHRDLKPANCLVNQDCTVKICDFGLSRAVGDAGVAPATSSLEDFGPPPPGSCRGPRLKRHLTGHVVTRWYRAPELILLQETYNEAIDIWSVGCIYAELLGMLQGTRLADRGPLFPGSSCFPLSPDNKHKTHNSRGKHDQLSMIFGLLGTPSAVDVAQLEREDAKRYVQCFAQRQGSGLRAKFPHAEAASVALLEGMLRFSPAERLSVSECLADGLFSEIRTPLKETKAASPVALEFEREPDLDEELLRRYFSKEVRRYQPEDTKPWRIGGA